MFNGTERRFMIHRSLLYVPGDRPDRLEGAPSRGADAVIIDWEDGVAVDRRDAARGTSLEWLNSPSRASCDIWVRVDAASLRADITELDGIAISGVIVPDARPETVAEAAAALAHGETDELPPRAVIALIESAAGVLDAPRTAGVERVHRLGIGRADLTADLRWSLPADAHELAGIYAQIVVASAAAGLAAPIAPTSIEFRDPDEVARTTAWFAARGFRGRTAIHPAQIPAIHRGLAPSADELAHARDVMRTYRVAQACGSGGGLDARGAFVDRAVARIAADVLARGGEPVEHL